MSPSWTVSGKSSRRFRLKRFWQTLRQFYALIALVPSAATDMPANGAVSHSARLVEIYGLLLPMLNSRRVDLLDDKKLVAQLVGLERRVARGGRDSIDHMPGAHDDIINSAAGSLVFANVEPFKIPMAAPIIVSSTRWWPNPEGLPTRGFG
jgi:hypothetical protein